MRVFELADELGVRSIDVLDACDDCGVAGVAAGSELTEDQVKRVRFAFNERTAAAVLAASSDAHLDAARQPHPTHPPGTTTAWTAQSATPYPTQPPAAWTAGHGSPEPPTQPPAAWTAGPGPVSAPPAAGAYPATMPAGTPVPRGFSKGMHPLIKRSLWHLGLAQVVPCFGLYFLISALVNAGKGRRQIAWSNQRYGGDTAGLVVQIVCWIELALMVLAVFYVLATAGNSSP